MIQLSNIMKSYRQGATVVDVLRGVNLEVAAGASVAIVGASGSGKSTLLSVMACMDRADSGRLVLNGRDATALTESELAQLRNRQLAIVFQSFELVPAFTALENVMLPLEIRGTTARAVAAEALHSVGLSHRLHHLPGQQLRAGHRSSDRDKLHVQHGIRRSRRRSVHRVRARQVQEQQRHDSVC